MRFHSDDEKTRRRIWLLLILAEVIVVIVALTEVLCGDRQELQFYGKEVPTCENAIPLSRGSYLVEIFYETSKDLVGIKPMMESSIGMVEGGTVLLPSYAGKKSFEIRVMESTEKFYFDSDQLSDGRLVITQFTIRETTQADTAGCVILIFLLFLLDVLLYLRQRRVFDRMPEKERSVLFGLVCVWFISSLPLFVNYMVRGYDFEFHMMRIEGLAKGLMSGQFPVKLQPGWMNGYGYPVSVMYGDLLLYLPALLRILGFTLQASSIRCPFTGS